MANSQICEKKKNNKHQKPLVTETETRKKSF